MRILRLAALACMLCMFASSAHAFALGDFVLIPDKDTWKYHTQIGYLNMEQGSALKHSDVDWGGVSWSTGQSAFGNQPGAAHINPVQTNWAKGTLLLEKVVNYEDSTKRYGGDYDVHALSLNVSVANSFALFVNGHQVAAIGNSEGYVPESEWEYTLVVRDLSGIWNQGADNLIQVVAFGGTDATYFDMDLRAYTDPHAAPTPVPAAVWLLGSGLAGLMAVRRRMSK